jgi:hypothetical protein
MQDGEEKEMFKVSEWVNQTASGAALCSAKKGWSGNGKSDLGCNCSNRIAGKPQNSAVF